ncbi:hypothetical protein RJ641_008514 [Dillenia turbinata]|uniref:Transmembrane protein n=1 Tax=Dillenia turbinata TaxID=194707 RepID=A0AAN8V3H2_9MAGN
MPTLVSLLLFISSLSFLSIARAQDRAPHGLAFENPIAFSPSAVEFFHPNAKPSASKDSCPTCSPLPLAAQVQSTPAHESSDSTTSQQSGGGRGIGPGGVVGIVFGFVFVVLLAMGVYYVVMTRRENTSRAKTIQPDI